MRACSTGSEHSKLLHIGVLHVRFACYMGGICAMRDPKLYIPSTIKTTHNSHFGQINNRLVSGRLTCTLGWTNKDLE